MAATLRLSHFIGNKLTTNHMKHINAPVNEWPQNNWNIVADTNLEIYRAKYLPSDFEIDAMYEEAQKQGLVPSAEEEHHND